MKIFLLLSFLQVRMLVAISRACLVSRSAVASTHRVDANEKLHACTWHTKNKAAVPPTAPAIAADCGLSGFPGLVKGSVGWVQAERSDNSGSIPWAVCVPTRPLRTHNEPRVTHAPVLVCIPTHRMLC